MYYKVLHIYFVYLLLSTPSGRIIIHSVMSTLLHFWILDHDIWQDEMISEYKIQINKLCLRFYPNRANILFSIEYFISINKFRFRFPSHISNLKQICTADKSYPHCINVIYLFLPGSVNGKANKTVAKNANNDDADEQWEHQDVMRAEDEASSLWLLFLDQEMLCDIIQI